MQAITYAVLCFGLLMVDVGGDANEDFNKKLWGDKYQKKCYISFGNIQFKPKLWGDSDALEMHRLIGCSATYAITAQSEGLYTFELRLGALCWLGLSVYGTGVISFTEQKEGYFDVFFNVSDGSSRSYQCKPK